jgi:hypothetical protein
VRPTTFKNNISQYRFILIDGKAFMLTAVSAEALTGQEAVTLSVRTQNVA